MLGMSERLVIRPPEQAEIDNPIIFLAGPIQGASDWQARAIEILHSANPDLVIASPRRDSFGERFDYREQVDWETEYLRRAGFNGVILFWLAKEQEQIPGRSYAQTTRFELAEWVTEHKYTGAKVVIGIEEGYSGARYVRHRLREYDGIPVVDSLETVCQEALNRM